MSRSTVNLLGLLGGRRSLRGILYDSNLFIDGVGVVGRWDVNKGISIKFLNNDVGVFMLFLTLAPDGAISDDGENPEHPEENTNTAAKDKCHGSALPATQIHQREVEASCERSAATMGMDMMVVVELSAVVLFMSRVIVRRAMRGAHEWHDVNDAMIRLLEGEVGIRFNKLQSEHFPESVRYLDTFLAEATHATTATRAVHMGPLNLPGI